MKNVVVRSISGVGFILVMLACLLFNKFLFAGLIIFMMVTMMGEFYRMTMGERYKFSRVLAIIAGIILFVLIFLLEAYSLPMAYISCALIPLLIVMINSLYVKDKADFGKFSFIYTGLLYIAVPLSLSNLLAFKEGEFNATLLLCFFIINWSSDVGAFVFGSAFGQKFGGKLFPSISPKKSWVGFWGGLFLAIVAALIIHLCGLFQFPILHCLGLATVIHIGGVYGDLFESQWKRYCEVKDSGNIIPGHGGMLDRFDSTLFATTLAALYLVIFNVQ